MAIETRDFPTRHSWRDAGSRGAAALFSHGIPAAAATRSPRESGDKLAGIMQQPLDSKIFAGGILR